MGVPFSHSDVMIEKRGKTGGGATRRQVFLAAFTGYFGMGEMFESAPDPAFLIIPPQADMSFGIELVCEP